MNNCVICNSDLDEKYANGIWDLSGMICGNINVDENEQDVIYTLIRKFIMEQNFCPNCGKNINKKKGD